MANKDHLAMIEAGVEDWNTWRKKNPDKIPDLREAHLFGKDLNGANLSGAHLRGAHLRKAHLIEAHLCRAYLRGADLFGADLDGAKLVEAHLVGADLRRANLISGDLRRADLVGAHLRGADLHDANLLGAQLREADLRAANLRAANLRGADLVEAYLRGSNLSGADLRGTALRGTDLREANLSDADLRGTDLSGADLRGADLVRADLSEAILDRVVIDSRSVLDDLKFSLSKDQKAGIVFSDEREEAKKKREGVDEKISPVLEVEFRDKVSWKNEWLAFWLLFFQATYNNLFYLYNTGDNNLDNIKSKLLRGCKVGARHDIEIMAIQQHSPLVLRYVQYAVENAPQVTAVLSGMAILINQITKSYKHLMEESKVRNEARKAKSEEKKIRVVTEENRFDLALQKEMLLPEETMESMKRAMEKLEIPTSNKTVVENKAELLNLASKKIQVALYVLKETANIGDIRATIAPGKTSTEA